MKIINTILWGVIFIIGLWLYSLRVEMRLSKLEDKVQTHLQEK